MSVSGPLPVDAHLCGQRNRMAVGTVLVGSFNRGNGVVQPCGVESCHEQSIAGSHVRGRLQAWSQWLNNSTRIASAPCRECARAHVMRARKTSHSAFTKLNTHG